MPRRIVHTGAARGRSLGIAALLTLAAPGAALADGIAHFTLTANVPLFCRIDPPQSDVVNLANGAAALGDIHEICNSPTGYQVTTQFTNLDAGSLQVGADALTVQSDGSAVRTSDEARSQTLAWSLSNAHLIQAAQPVLVQVTIEPR